MRWKRKNRSKNKFGFNKTAFIIFVALVLLFLMGFIIFKSPLLVIKKIDILSNKMECTDQNSIKQVTNLFGQNILLINYSKTKNNLKEKFYCISDIIFLKNFPNKIKIKIINRQPAAIFLLSKYQTASQSSILEQFTESEASSSAEATSSAQTDVNSLYEKFVIDKEGVVFSKEDSEVNIPLIYASNLNLTLGQKLDSNLIGDILKILDNVKTFGLDVKSVKLLDQKYLLVVSKPKVIFEINDQIDIKLASLQLILKTAKIDSSTIEFIDLRYDKPVVRYAPKKS